MPPIVASLLDRWHTGKRLVFLKMHEFCCFFSRKLQICHCYYLQICRSRIVWNQVRFNNLVFASTGMRISGCCHQWGKSCRLPTKMQPKWRKGGVYWLRWDGKGLTLRELLWVGEVGHASQAQACLLPLWHLLDLSYVPSHPILAKMATSRFIFHHSQLREGARTSFCSLGSGEERRHC